MTTDVESMTSSAPLEDTTYTHDGPQTTTSQFGISFSTSWKVGPLLGVFLIGICIFGFVANLSMLVSLRRQKHTARKTVNIFVCNQMTLDLVAAFISAIKMFLVMSGYLKTKADVLRMFPIHEACEQSRLCSILSFLYTAVG